MARSKEKQIEALWFSILWFYFSNYFIWMHKVNWFGNVLIYLLEKRENFQNRTFMVHKLYFQKYNSIADNVRKPYRMASCKFIIKKNKNKKGHMQDMDSNSLEKVDYWNKQTATYKYSGICLK